MAQTNIYFFIGTTAELIKLAPVMRELDKRKISYKIISSNQNVLNFKELEPLLGKKSADYTFKMKHFDWPKNVYLRFVFWVIKSVGNYWIYFKNKFKKENRKEIIFIVHGDTISALMGAIIAKLSGVKLAHVEAGLRSYNFLEPFPEEINRFVISHLADVHFCPNSWSVKNLKDRGGKKINTGVNTVSESIGKILKNKRKNRFFKKEKYFVLVVHRQEHTLFSKKATKKMIEAILAQTDGKFKCAFIMHKLTKEYLKKYRLLAKLKKNKNIKFIPRLPYTDFVSLMADAEFIATDGGSNQEEAFYMGKPCLILRNRTERIEGLKKNAILSKKQDKLIKKFIDNYKMYKQEKPKYNSTASKIIVDYLTK